MAEIILSHCSAVASWQLSLSTALQNMGNPWRKPREKKSGEQGPTKAGRNGVAWSKEKRMEEENNKSNSCIERGNNLLP